MDYFDYHGNGKISDSTFNNNSAAKRGGAIYWNGNDGKISRSSFTDNNATEFGGAICWEDHTEIHGEDDVPDDHEILKEIENFRSKLHGEVSHSNFTNNSADNAGAVYWYGDSGNITKSNFTDNHAIGDDINTGNAGAINWAGEDGYISECIFIDNDATSKGGAIYWGFLDEEQPDPSQGAIGTIMKSNFTNNSATEEGGAIFWYSDEGNISDNCYFITNNATEGGAVYWYGPSGNINDHCYFISNSAIGYSYETSDGGRYVYGNGGAVYWYGPSGNINDNCYFISNTADYGGASYINGDGLAIDEANFTNNSAAKNGGASYIKGESSSITHANFTGNTAVLGGAIYTEGNYLTIDVAYFNNNNATSGSAIYKKEGATGYRISNVIFDRNQAYSEVKINVEVTDGDKSFAKADVTFEVTFRGLDNIANAIWDNDDESMILFKNITFDFSYDGKGRELQSFNEEWGTPTGGFEDESSIWQDPCEDAQLVNIIVRDQNDAVILNITNGADVTQNTRGLLSAKRYDEAEDMIVTDVDGKISWTLPGLSAGTYTIEAVHDEDAYYTRADGQGSFVINEITKTTEDIFVAINQTVTYNITITNNGDEAIESINITDDYPEELDLLSYQTKWFAPDPHDNWKWERYDGTNIFYINNGNGDLSSFIPEGESVVLILVFKAIEKGTFSNTAKVESYSTLPFVVTSQKTTVADVVLNVTKTANVTFTANNTLVNYTIVVNNAGLIDVTEVNIVDVLPGNLTYAGKWGVVEANGARITEVSALNWEVSDIAAGSHVSIWFTANVTAHKIGNITNVVKVSCNENDTEVSDEANVTVLPTITKHVNKTICDVNDKVNYTIFIDVTGADLSELLVNDDLDDSFDVVSVSEDWEYNGTKHVFKYLPTTIPDTLTLNFTVKVTKTGKYTNFASIQIGDMPEVTAESEEITVYNPDVDITKTVVEPRTVNLGEQVAFIINVTNTGDRALNPLEVIVWEDFGGLSGDYIEEIKGQWIAVDAALPYYALESTLDVDDYACFKIYFTTKSVGKFYNNATVERFDKQDSDYVEVLPNITKHVDKSDINVGESVEYSIFIDATGLSEKLVIKDILNESFVLDESSISENWEYDEADHAFKYKLSDISGPLTLKFKVNITKVGNYTNVASLEINDLPEVTAESEVTRVREVILNVTKDVNGATVVANNTLVNYTINVSNIGDANATLVNIVDVLPGNLTYTGKWGVIEANGASVDNSTLSWEVSNITAGSYVSIWFAAIVNTDVAGVITNVVNVDCSENRTKVSDDADVTVVPVVLNVTKTANATAVAKGVLINYTIVIDNIGPGNATTVNVTDILPDGLIYNRWGVIDAKGAAVTNKTLSDGVEWIISNITAGSSITLWVEVKSESYGNLTNYVTVNSKENKTLVGDDWTVEVGPVVLKVDKVVNGATVVANNTLVNYTITVSNVGRINATLVNIADILPDNLTYAGKWGIIEANGADISNTALSWTVSNITAGSHVSIWLAATVNTDEAGNITNVVRVNCKENGTVVSSKADVTVVPVVLNVTKTANVTVVANNTLVNYTIVVDNIGDANATLVNVVDLLPVGLVCTNADVIDADGASVLITISPNGVEWTISNITAGKSVSLWIAVRTTAVGNFTNNVTVNSKENKTLVKDNETVDVLPVALNVTKTANVTVVANNTLVNYTIIVSSIAKVNATLVNIADALPGNLTYAGKWGIIEANGAAINEISPLTWEVSDIAAGSHVSIWFTVTVNTGETGNITNVVRVKCNENDTVVSAEANITVVPVVLNVTKTANVTVVANNTLVNYTIVVDNIGEGNATLVNVNDVLPVGLVYSDWGIIEANGASVTNTTLANGVEWIISNIAAGKSVSLWIAVRTTVVGNFTNNVTVYSNENKTKVKDNETVEVLPVVLNVTKVANATVVANNTLVNYTITVSNVGRVNATLVNIVDVLPGNLTYAGKWGIIEANGADISNTALSWEVSNIAAGSYVSIWFTVTVNTSETGNITNVVRVNCSENKTQVSDEANVTVVPVILTVNKTANVTYVGKDRYVTFKIVVNNTSEVNATDVVVLDNLPEGLKYVSSTTVIGDKEYPFKPSQDKMSFTWTMPKLYGSIVLYITVKTTEYGNFTNNVTVTCKENNTPVKDNETVHVVPANVSIVKTANDTLVSVGDSVEFTLNVTNTGLIEATDINVTDLLDAAFEVQSIGNGTYLKYNDTERIVWNIPSLDVGDSTFVTVVVKLTREGTFNNTAVVKTPETNETNSTVNVTAKIPTHTTVSNVTTYPDTTVNITVNVTADDGKIINGNVTVYFPDGSNKTVEIINGTGNTTWHVPANYTPGNYTDWAVYDGNETYFGSEGIGNIEVLPIPTHTTVSNVTTYPDTDVDIFVNVTADDGKPVNGNVTVVLPDGSNRTVLIVNGTGNTTWHVPANYTPGNYSVPAKFAGNETYLPSNGTGNIEVLPIPTHTVVGNVTTYPDTNVTVPINVTADDNKPVNGNVTITFPDGSNQTVLIVNGTGNATWHVPANYTPGNYTEFAVFSGNETYLPSNGTGNIEVLPIPTHTTVGNVTTYPDTDVVIPINVTADDNKTFSGNVTITFPDGSNQTVEIVNGTGNATWHVPANYTPGDYPDFAVFDGNETYLPSNGTGNIEVLPIPTHTTVENVTGIAGQNVTIPVNVTADDDKPFNGNVTITFPDGTNQTVEIVNGTGNATWTIPEDYGGVYNDTVSYPGNETYLPSNGNGTITVIPKIPTHTVVGNVTTYPDSDVTIPVNVTADDGIPFNGNVTITFPDGSNKTVEIINGTGNTTWHVPVNYTPGNYTDFAVFDGNENYFPSNGTGNIEVLPIPTHTTVGNVTAYPGRNVTIPVNVTADDGKPFNGNVTITFPDGTNQTVEIINGTGNATWTVPQNYVPGDYPDKDSYTGNETYLPSNGNGIITVLPIPTTVSIGNITTYPGENVTIPIYATVFDDEPFTGNVTVQMPDGSIQTVEIINGTGNITWFVPENYVPDNYTDTIKFLGNETYLPSNGTGNIEVIKIPTHVTIGNVTAYPGEDVTIPINVTADNGKPFNGNVTVKLPDGTNQTVEIINGTGNITWTVPDDYSPDVYNDTIEVIGDEKYLPSNGTGHVEVVRIPTHITVGNVTTFAGRDVTIPINVTADDGKPFTGNVTITLPDGSTKTVEIINGTGTTTWFVPRDYTPDKYPDAVRFDGDVKYLPSEGKGTITVIKIPVDIVVGNVTAHPGDKVTIPIEVIPRDGSLFNGDVTVELPDGTKKVVEIADGKGSVDWTIPKDYKGNYLVKVSSDETEVYYPANGTGVITVIVDNHTAENATETPQKDMPKGTLARYETGNPILALLAVLAVLGISVKRKK